MPAAQKTASQIFTLSNGTKLVYTHLSTAPRLALSLFLPTGYSADPVPGTAELLSRLLFKGTKTHSQEEIAIAIDGLTLEVDSAAKRDCLALHATFLEEDLSASLDLLSDVFYNVTFAEFLKEKQKLAGEIMMDLDSPKSCASDLLSRTVWNQTSYSASSSVIAEHLDTIEAGAIQQLYQQAFKTETLTVVATGATSPEVLIEAFQKAFPATAQQGSSGSSGSSGLFHPYTSVETIQTLSIEASKTVSIAKDDSSQAHIYKAWLMPNATSPDFAAISLLNTILGGAGLTSRLFLELRDKQGLAYNVRSSYEAYRHKGLFSLYIGTEPANKNKCLEGFDIEIDKLCSIRVDETELADAKRNWLGHRAIMLETAPQKTAFLGGSLMLGRTLSEIEAMPETLNKVTADDIQRVARQYLTLPAIIAIAAPSSAL
jgi:zinc protease